MNRSHNLLPYVEKINNEVKNGTFQYYSTMHNYIRVIIDHIQNDTMTEYVKELIDNNIEILLNDEVFKSIQDNLSTSATARQLYKQISNYTSTNKSLYDF